MRVLGIDPGLRALGWGVIDVEGSRLAHVANGVCRPSGRALSDRLFDLHRLLSEVIRRHVPDAAAVEETFVNRDGRGALKLGQARGVALLCPAQAGLPVGEYAPATIKKCVVGTGQAGKEQIGHMVAVLLPGAAIGGSDAADALAVAICHAHHLSGAGRLAAALGRAS